MFGSGPILNRFDKVDGFIYGTTYLVLFGSEKYDTIYNSNKCLISLKSGITYITSHNYAKTKIYSYAYLPLEKR